MPVGATLVRHSDPYGEVSETHGKAAGVLGAIGAVPRDRSAEPRRRRDAIDDAMPPPPSRVRSPTTRDDRRAARLAQRPARVVLAEPAGAARRPARSPGARAIVVDAEDRFTTMLAHQLRHLGLDVAIVPWSEVTDEQLDDAELVVSGPGPAIRAIRALPACGGCARSSRAVAARAGRCSPCA